MNTHDEDTDPTGMRALLRGLPDPGPMPDDLVTRIHASLADLEPLAGQGLDESNGDRSAVGGVSRGTTVSSRPSWWARHGGKAAVAAVVLIGGGALATGQLGSLGSGDDASTAGSVDSDLSRADPRTYAESDPDAVSPQKGTDGAGQEAALGTVVVQLSGRAYTTAGLANELGRVTSGATTTPLTAEAPSIGPIGTEIGVRSCLEALGLPRATGASVDLSTLDGTPAAVLVVTLGGERTAYAVGRDCTTNKPSVLAGPIALP